MPVIRRNDPMTEQEGADIQRRLSLPKPKPPSIAKGLTICCVGVGAVLSAPFVAHIVSKNTGAPLLVFLCGLGAAVVGAWLIVIHLTQAPRQRRYEQEYARSLDAALARGTMLVIEIVADAAWSDLGADDDASAIFLRVGQGQYAYVNNSWLNQLPVFDRSEWKRFPSRVTLRMLDEEWRELTVEGEGEEIEVRDDILGLPESRIIDGVWPEILGKPEHWGTPLLELTDADMPPSWLPVLRRP